MKKKAKVLVFLFMTALFGCAKEEKLIAKVLKDANAKKENIVYRHDINREDFYYFICKDGELIMYSGTVFLSADMGQKVKLPAERIRCE